MTGVNQNKLHMFPFSFTYVKKNECFHLFLLNISAETREMIILNCDIEVIQQDLGISLTLRYLFGEEGR